MAASWKKKKQLLKLNADNLPEVLEKTGGFQLSAKGRQALSVATAMRNTKHALYARAPMVCKGVDCPSYATCPLAQYDLTPEGERCPVEISALVDMFEKYCEELRVKEDDFVDMTLVRELVAIDVQLDRAADRLAAEDFIQEVNVGVTESGRAIKKPEIHKAFEVQEKLMKRRHEILQLLNSTRKDKAGSKVTLAVDPSVQAAQLIARKRALDAQKESEMINITPDNGESDE